MRKRLAARLFGTHMDEKVVVEREHGDQVHGGAAGHSQRAHEAVLERHAGAFGRHRRVLEPDDLDIWIGQMIGSIRG
jgi:hypothetical protein